MRHLHTWHAGCASACIDKKPEISFRNVVKTPELEVFIHRKIQHLERFCEDIVSAHLDIERDEPHPSAGSGFRVRLDVRIPPGRELVSEEPSSHGTPQDTLQIVLGRVFDGAERQIKKLVERRRDYERETPHDDNVGIVTHVDGDKRFGFLKTPAGEDVYFEAGVVTNNDFDRIDVGTSARYTPEVTDQGLRATRIHIVDKKGQPMVSDQPQ
jgi:cold shock CspA family protein